MTMFSRRAFALGLSTATLATGALPLLGGATNACDSAKAVMPLAPLKAVTTLAQIKIGRFTVTALSDGFADMPFSYFPGRTPQQVEEAAITQFAAKPDGIRFMFNQYLVENGEQRILIDAGPAGSLGQSGHLPQALASLGLRADQI